VVATHNISTSDGDSLVLIGTMKGAFILRSPAGRDSWELGGPYLPGHSVFALAYDGRNGRNRIWAAASSMHWGAVLCSSDDFGATWTVPETATVRFPENSGDSLKQIWQIQLGPRDEPDTLYCGVEPAALFKSTDAGSTWRLVEGLYNHPHRAKWEPGGGGLCLHTILVDPVNSKRMFIAVSTGGVYRTDDGGETWQSRNNGVRAVFLPDKYPEFGQCVHKIVLHPKNQNRLFLQNHWGLYRSDDGGDNWKDIANGVPSDFGFAMASDPNDENAVYIIPIESDEFRCTPDGKVRVYKTEDAGDSWQPLANGLPQNNAFETILRDGMATDRGNPTGIYFGTKNGKVFGSTDAGASWSSLADGLPSVVCVKTAVV
jgi:Sortilin, neurotensin receptor 3,